MKLRRAMCRRRLFQLNSLGGATTSSVVSLISESNGRKRRILLPNITGIIYYVLVMPGASITPSVPGTLDIVEIQEPLATARKLWLSATSDKHRKFCFPGIVVVASGQRRRRRRFSRFIQHLMMLGIDLAGDRVLKFPELLLGWDEKSHPPIASKAQCGRLAAVTHLYYVETFPEIAALIASRKQAIDVLVTMPPENSGYSDEIRKYFPDAKIFIVENCGRDIRPFLMLLESGALDPYDAICKLHGKKSSDPKQLEQYGDYWRRRSFFDLLGGQDALDWICERFVSDPLLGMIGPRVFRYPREIYTLERSWGENEPVVMNLIKRMGQARDSFTLDFFAGSMFWARPAALAPLRQLGLVSASFAPESGKLDGALEHAVERIFIAAAKQAGYSVTDIDALSLPKE
jgi:lipopolysaccharide biosynthesis protein